MKTICLDGKIVVNFSDNVANAVIATRRCSRFDTADLRAATLAQHALQQLGEDEAARFSHEVPDVVDDERADDTAYSRFALRVLRHSTGIYIDFDVRRVDPRSINVAALLAADTLARSRARTPRADRLHDDHFIRRL